jgi:hypothetical protein
MSYAKGTPLIGDCRAGIINSVWTNNERAEKDRLINLNRSRTAIYI